MSDNTVDYKYRIAVILATLPMKENRRVRREIIEALGLTFVTFSRRLYALESETLDFSGSELRFIAEKLKVNINELFNNPTPSVSTPC